MKTDDIDLTDVDPVRRNEIRRRVRIVKEFVAIADPTPMDAARAATRMGVRVRQFETIVAAWLAHGRAADLPGAGRTTATSPGPDPRGRRLPSAGTEQAMLEVLNEARADDRPPTLHDRVVTLCAERGVAPPSLSALRDRIRARQLEAPAPVGRKNLVIVGRCATSLPIRRDDGTVGRAVLTVAILSENARVVASDLSADAREGAIAETVAAAMRRSDPLAPVARLALVLRKSTERTALQHALWAVGLGDKAEWHNPLEPGFVVPTLLGRRLGRIGLSCLGQQSARPSKLLKNRLAEPLTLADATRYLAGEIERHNSARDRDAVPFRLGDPAAAAILERLAGRKVTGRRPT